MTAVRTDLPWLRRVSRPAPPAAAPAAPAAAVAPRIDTRHHDSGRPSADGPRPRIDTRHHGVPEGPAGRDLLDLSARAEPAGPVRRAALRREPPRVRTGQPPRLLTTAAPTVTLTRLQAGVGQLRIELVASEAVGDLRLGVAYETTDRRSSLLLEGGPADAGPDPRRPLVRLVRGRWAAVLVDLRQNRSLRRLLLLGVSADGNPLRWGGTVVVTTHAGARVEAPVELGDHTGPAALLSLHVVDGEHVLRAENEPLTGSLRELALAHGYDRITWADDRTPAG